jgi:hypothetical protein
MKTYYYKQNNREYSNELEHLVMNNHTNKPVASHLEKETAMNHISKNNKRFPYGFRTTEEKREIIMKRYED